MRHAIVGFFFVASALVFHVTFGRYFDPTTTVGSDLSLALPSLLDGYYWFLNNGIFTPPWFTPAFCAGQPFFADPQSSFYSPIQFLAFLIDPLHASYLAMLLLGTIGYWGMYLYCNERLGAGEMESSLAAALWFFNGFLTHHYIIGHLGFLHFYIAPLIAWILIARSHSGFRTSLLRIASVGLLLASCLHSGLGTLMIPLGLCVWALGCIAIVRGAPWRPFYCHAGLAAILGFAISASKLNAAFALLAHIPRDQYPLPGIASISSLLEFVIGLFFQPEEPRFFEMARLLVNRAIGVGPHELAFDLTPVPAVLLLTAFLRRSRSDTPGSSTQFQSSSSRIIHLSLLAGIILAPLMILYYSPEWNAVLKTIPIIRSTGSPWRWLVLIQPIICAGTALLLARSFSTNSLLRSLLCVASLVALLTLKVTAPRDYYDNQSYDPTPIGEAYRQAKTPGFRPEIKAIGTYQDENGNTVGTMHQNDLITMQVSQAFCYNPVFGYGLEKFDARTLRPGNPLRSQDGVLNIKNPSCYVFPEQNACTPGDHFTDDEYGRQSARALISYQPWEFKKPALQELADALTLFALLVAVGFCIVGVLPKQVFSRKRA